ncbi:MAG: PTS sugar transporter subunit IIA [Planctomycetes bacterium]|nr:PTS sugar transporter subunit IIA [Planctomycetota bacterium]MBL7041337.1 PTS sugar transporter subunit IIA [Pirellulaceae bacterium]
MTTTRIAHNPIEAHPPWSDGGNGQRPSAEGSLPFGDRFDTGFDLTHLADEFRFVVPESILPDLNVPSKDLAIRTMVGSLAETGVIPEAEQELVADAIIRREQLGSTGIGRGIAIPHTKHGAVDRVVATMAYSREGIDFDSLDGQPVHLLLLLVSPPDNPNEHLRALEAVSRCLANRRYRVWRTDDRHTDDECR